ncbi:MAG: hypothetical protein V4586_02475 [Pseudomonadota bacterium]
MTETYFETDEYRDVLFSLRHCVMCAKAAPNDPSFWKWAIISFHNALQGALVCFLSGTQQLGSLRADDGKIWLEYQKNHGDGREPGPTDRRLAPIRVLFERVTTGKQLGKKGAPIEWVKDRDFTPICFDDNGFEYLVSLRNSLSHFVPSGWSIEISELPAIIGNLAKLIEKIHEEGWAFRHLTDEEHLELRALLHFLTEQATAPFPLFD